MSDVAPAYQPELTWRGHAWRLAVTVAISGVVAGAGLPEVWRHHRALFWLDLATGPVAFVLVHLRRRWPLPIALAVNVLGWVSATASGPGILAVFSLSTRRRWSEVLPVAAVSLVGGLTYPALQGTTHGWAETTVSFVFGVLVTAIIVGWGMYVGSRRELVWELRQRAERAEAEQGLRAERARGNERARIAREMHDVLAHRMSQVSMRAGALAFRTDLEPATMRTEAGEIQRQANDALTELRAVLGVLRQETGEPLDRPQPTYGDLAELVTRAAGTDGRIELVDEVTEPVPDALGRTVFRIVQEGITNATKHAPGCAVTIRVSGSPGGELRVVLRNPLGWAPTSTPGSGLGLIGLAERVELRGGRLTHRVEAGHFVLEGWLPWEG